MASNAWHPVRAAVTYPLSSTAMAIDQAYGLLPGNNVACTWNSANWVYVCSGAPTILGAGATTFGGVINTGYSYCDFLAANDGRLMAHETKHSDQWAIFGPGFAVLDSLAAVGSLGHARYNPFEIWAGLKDGGYERPHQ